MTGAQAKDKLQKQAGELDRIRQDMDNLLNRMNGDFKGIGVESVVSAGRRASTNCYNIAYTLRCLNTSFLDKKKKNGNGGGGGRAWGNETWSSGAW